MLSGLLLFTLSTFAGDVSAGDPAHRALVLETQGRIVPGPATVLDRDATLRAWAPLRDGDAFFVEPGADISILCSDGTCARLRESFVVGPETCASAGSCQDAILPTSSPSDEGRLVLEDWTAAKGHWQLAGSARGPAERWGHDPVLISPRCPALGPPRGCESWLDDPQELIFLAIEEADRYLFSLTGAGRFEPEIVAAENLGECRPWPAFAGALVCRHSWPETWQLPESGLSVKLAFKVEVAGKFRVAEHRQRLQRAISPERRRAFEQVAGLEGDLLRSLVNANSDADAQLFASLAGHDSLSPALVLKSAQLYLQRDFFRPAEHLFQGLVEPGRAANPRLVAEAKLGLAHAYFLLDRPEESGRQLKRAELAFERLGLDIHREQIDKLRRRIYSASSAN